MYERFLVHRTVFPRDFLADLGFRTLRSAGRVELARLDFGGLQPVLAGSRASVLARLREVFAPAKPVPVPRPRPREVLQRDSVLRERPASASASTSSAI